MVTIRWRDLLDSQKWSKPIIHFTHMTNSQMDERRVTNRSDGHQSKKELAGQPVGKTSHSQQRNGQIWPNRLAKYGQIGQMATDRRRNWMAIVSNEMAKYGQTGWMMAKNGQLSWQMIKCMNDKQPPRIGIIQSNWSDGHWSKKHLNGQMDDTLRLEYQRDGQILPNGLMMIKKDPMDGWWPNMANNSQMDGWWPRMAT